MSHLKLILIILFGSFYCYAEKFPYVMEGSYKLQTSPNSLVKFSLKWSELHGAIEGIYSDSFFAKSAAVSGEATTSGRTFNVKYPVVMKGLRSLTILSPFLVPSNEATSLPLYIVARDATGNPLNNINTQSRFYKVVEKGLPQLQEERGCIEGFGDLADYCGIYSGMIAESQDRRNKCNLLFADSVRLEIKPDATVILHLGDGHELIEIPSHIIGRLPFNPKKMTIDLLGRHCGPLSGVKSASGSCKVLHLTGRFSTVRDVRHFSGEYQIVEEATNNVCKYSLSLDRRQLL
jgi:hypothetical protein